MEQASELDFAALHRQYESRVFGFCLKLCGDCRPEAEDLAQETFIAAWRAWPGFRGRSYVFTWLCGIAKRIEPLVQNSRDRLRPWLADDLIPTLCDPDWQPRSDYPPQPVDPAEAGACRGIQPAE